MYKWLPLRHAQRLKRFVADYAVGLTESSKKIPQNHTKTTNGM